MIAFLQPDAPLKAPPLDNVMELSFLISRTQFEALESAAQQANVSVAQYLRRLVQYSVGPRTEGADSRS